MRRLDGDRSGGWVFGLGLSVALLGEVAYGAIIDVPGNGTGNYDALTHSLNTMVGAGNTGRLMGNFYTHWNGGIGSFSVAVDTNGFQLNLDTGNGNSGHVASGPISGTGVVRVSAAPHTSALWNVAYTISGSTANTYTGGTQVLKGSLVLSKSPGVTALMGPIAVGSATVPARVRLGADEQIDDAASVVISNSTVTGSTADAGKSFLDLDGHDETIASLELMGSGTGAAQVRTGNGGTLTVTSLRVNGVDFAAGTYTAVTHPQILTGSGSIVVPGGGNSTVVEVADGYEGLNVAEDLAAGDGSVNLRLLGSATFGEETGTLSGSIEIPAGALIVRAEGEPVILSGAIQGAGSLIWRGGTTTETLGVASFLAGVESNTLTGVTKVESGTLVLAKASGGTAIAGPVEVGGEAGVGVVLRWSAEEQIADASPMVVSGLTPVLLDLDGYSETLGTLDLGGSLEWDASGVLHDLRFAASDEVAWASSGNLMISGWSGNVQGGQKGRLFFGEDGSGLNATQLASIFFVNPGGFPEGLFPAKMLASGEVIPDADPLRYVQVPDGYINDDITQDLGLGDAGTHYQFLGDAELGWRTGTLNGDLLVSSADGVLTMNTGGGNLTRFNGVLEGEGSLLWNGGGAPAMQTYASFLGGTAANTMSGRLTVWRGTLALAKPAGVTAVAGPITVGGGTNQAILRWDADDQVADTSPVTLSGPNAARLWFQGHSEVLGTLRVEGEGEIHPGEGSAVIRFEDSSAVEWSASAQCLIRGWNGLLEGGGEEQIYFGNFSTGLTAEQLAMVGFEDPEGLPPGIYTAVLLETGELVPSGVLVEPVSPPYDLSPAAMAAREAIYQVDGLAAMVGPESNLAEGTRVVFFGDSITWQDAYVTRMRDALSGAGKNVTLINRGINGGGVLQVLEGSADNAYPGSSAQGAFADLLVSDQADIAVVFVGVNDVWWRGTSYEAYRNGLREIASQASAAGVKLVFATPAAYGESPLGQGSLDPQLDTFAQAVRDVATSTGAALVDLRQVFQAWWKNHNYKILLSGEYVVDVEYGLLTYDGVHPTDAGNDLIAEHMALGLLGAAVPSPASDAYADWAAAEGLEGEDADALADPDKDGVPNALEFLFGSVPAANQIGAGVLEGSMPVLEDQGDELVLFYKRTDVSEGVMDSVGQWSDDLETWHDIEPELVAENGFDADDMKVSVAKSVTTKGRLWIRVKALP